MEIFNLVHRNGASTAELWIALRQLFQDNIDARANNLHTELRNTVQGDAPVGVYCQRLKAIADELREFGDPISDITSSSMSSSSASVSGSRNMPPSSL
jgi:hypothetical protein